MSDLYEALASAIYVSRQTLAGAAIDTDDQRIRASGLYETWSEGSYQVGDIRNTEDQTWECFQMCIRDRFKPVMDMFSQFANRSGMNTRDYISYIRQEAKKSEGMSSEEAKRAVELEDREATVAAKEAAEADPVSYTHLDVYKRQKRVSFEPFQKFINRHQRSSFIPLSGAA